MKFGLFIVRFNLRNNPNLKKLVKGVLFSTLLFSFNLLFAQKEANIWYFGTKGGIDFNSGSPVPLLNGQLISQEGCATICDRNGNLLFYTDGTRVWNKAHTIMPNGNGLGGNYSATQSAIIVPRPKSSTQYYIFTVDAWAGKNPKSTGNGGMNLNLVDMTLDGGLGDVVTKDQLIVSPTCEKITATKHCNGSDYWIVTHKWGSDSLLAYLLTNSGLNSTPVVSHSGVTMTGATSDSAYQSIGYMKISPSGKRIAFVCYSTLHTMAVGDFDNATGIASSFIIDNTIPFTPTPLDHNNHGIYGLAFSPDNSKLYTSGQGPNGLYQYNISSGNPGAVLASRTLISTSNTTSYGALQLAPDGKIYLGNGGSFKLSAVTNPNGLGAACNFVPDEFSFGNFSHLCEIGLPDFIENFVVPNYKAQFHYQDCAGDNYITLVDSFLTGPVTILWDFGDPSSSDNTSNIPQPTHTFSSAGDYTITATINYACGDFSVSKDITVVDKFTVFAGTDMTILPGNNALINASAPTGNYTWTPATGLSSSFVLQPTASPRQTTTYTLQVTNEFNCTNTDSVIVFVDYSTHLFFPNAFSPNGDGMNDYFNYYAYGINTINLQIFNRWGEVVFQTDHLNVWWDGKRNNKPEPVGAYVYMAVATGLDGKQTVWKGDLTLIR